MKDLQSSDRLIGIAFVVLAVALYWLAPYIMASWFWLSGGWLYRSAGAWLQLLGASRLTMIGALVLVLALCRGRLTLGWLGASLVIGWLVCGFSIVTDIAMLVRWTEDVRSASSLAEYLVDDSPELVFRRLTMPLNLAGQGVGIEVARSASLLAKLAWLSTMLLLIHFATRFAWRRWVSKAIDEREAIYRLGNIALLSFGWAVYGNLANVDTIFVNGYDGVLIYSLVVFAAGLVCDFIVKLCVTLVLRRSILRAPMNAFL